MSSDPRPPFTATSEADAEQVDAAADQAIVDLLARYRPRPPPPELRQRLLASATQQTALQSWLPELWCAAAILFAAVLGSALDRRPSSLPRPTRPSDLHANLQVPIVPPTLTTAALQRRISP